MVKSKRMSEAELASALDGQINDAKSYDGTDRAEHREWALRFFEGEVDIPPMGDDRSSVVSRDVADTHGLIMPGLLRVFFASDKVAIYEPTKQVWEEEIVPGPDGVPRRIRKDVSQERADQATDLVNYIVMKECDGYRLFRDAFSDGLLLGNGIVKHWWDSTPEYATDTYSGLTEDEYKLVISDPDIEEEVEHKVYDDPDFVPPELPPEAALVAALAEAGEAPPEAVTALAVAVQAPQLHDVTVKRIRSNGRLRLAALPSEEFLIERSAKVLDETVRFCAHVQRRKTRSDLIKEGYAKDKIDALPTYNNLDDTVERQARDNLTWAADKAPDKSTEFVEIYECYVLLDFDGDGIAERRRVVIAGVGGKRSILSNEPWGDDLPFSDIVPEPRAHTWRGRGLYDEMADIQRVKSVGLRGILDNTYQQLVPQREVEIDAYENMDEVYNPSHGGVLLRRPGKQPMAPVTIPYIADKVFGVLEYMDAVGEKRTGVSQRTQALDMDALQNQSATAVNAAMAAVGAKTEEYARNIAECAGMKRIFRCVLRLITKHQDRTKTIRLRGKWVDIDPRTWTADMDVTINTGLGTGSREKDFAILGGVAAKQEMLIQQFGPFNETLNVGHLLETYRKIAESGGVKNADSFFPQLSQDDIAKFRQQAAESAKNKPDPKMLEMQAKLQMEQAKAQGDMQLRQQEAIAEMQLAQAKAAAELEAARERNMLQIAADQERFSQELQLMRERAQAEILVEREKAQAHIQMRREEMAIEAELTAQANAMKMAQSVPVADTNIDRPSA